MPLDPLDLVNEAFSDIAADPIEDLDEETFGGQSAALKYQRTIDFMLGIYPFSWARKMVQLSKLDNETSLYGYSAVYQLPADRLGAPMRIADQLSPGCRFNDYVLSADQVHANAEQLYAEIKFLPLPGAWSAAFRAAAVKALAAAFCVPVTHDKGLAKDLHELAFGGAAEAFKGGLMGGAIREDSFATPPRPVQSGNDPLTRAWRS